MGLCVETYLEFQIPLENHFLLLLDFQNPEFPRNYLLDIL